MALPLFFVGGRWTEDDPADYDADPLVDFDLWDDPEMDQWDEWERELYDEGPEGIPDPEPYDDEPFYMPHCLTRAYRGHVPAPSTVQGDHGRHSSGYRKWEKRYKARAERRKAKLRPDTPPTYHRHRGHLW